MKRIYTEAELVPQWNSNDTGRSRQTMLSALKTAISS